MRRRKDKVDSNQPAIVAYLRKFPGVTVETGHDDILVGRNGFTWWFEIKHPDTKLKSGGYKKGAVKDDQFRLLANWKGHYQIVSGIDEILTAIGIQ